MNAWVRERCAWCGILWRVVHVDYLTRGIGNQPQRKPLCLDMCLPRMQALSECQGRKHGLYEYVRQAPTYVHRDTWGNKETREITAPQTHAGQSSESLIGELVRARPYYHVPDTRHSLKRARSHVTYEARVVDSALLASMVYVEYTWVTGSSPWKPRQLFYPRELHLATCECAACVGDGNHELDGA